jgi:ankyrin repeat protein
MVRVRWFHNALWEAASKGDGAAVARLLGAGADPNASVHGEREFHLSTARTPSGEVVQPQTTALLAAVQHSSQLETARLLLEGGADPSRADGDGITPLMVAAVNGRVDLAQLLLDAGADPSRADGDGTTPLMASVAHGHLGESCAVLRLLLARGAVVDAVNTGTRGTAFHAACYNNEPECAEALAWAGCDGGLKDSNGSPGRQLAEQAGHTAVVERLRAVVTEQLRARIIAIPARIPRAALAAPTYAPEPHPDGPDASWPTLPEADVFPDELFRGRAAAVGGDGLDHHADGDFKTMPPQPDLLVALQLGTAACGGDGAAAARLLAAGADPNASVRVQSVSGAENQSTVLIMAAQNDRLEVVQLLLEASADPSRASSDGTTSRGR